jgi:hypothetical protein
MTEVETASETSHFERSEKSPLMLWTVVGRFLAALGMTKQGDKTSGSERRERWPSREVGHGPKKSPPSLRVAAMMGV